MEVEGGGGGGVGRTYFTSLNSGYLLGVLMTDLRSLTSFWSELDLKRNNDSLVTEMDNLFSSFSLLNDIEMHRSNTRLIIAVIAVEPVILCEQGKKGQHIDKTIQNDPFASFVCQITDN